MLKVSKRDNVDRYYLLKLFGFGIFVHHIHHSEQTGVYHNHPWPWFSVVFGGYREQLPNEVVKPVKYFNFKPSKQHHRLEVDKPVWTLLFHGRRNNEWTVVDDSMTILSKEPWRGIGGRTSYKPAVEK